jgi:hypothetical protein
MTIKQLLEATGLPKFGVNITATVSRFRIKEAGNTGKNVAEITLSDGTGEIGFSIWEKKKDGTDNPAYGIYKIGDKIKITKGWVSHDDFKDVNKLALQKDGNVTKVGTGEVPTTVQEEPVKSSGEVARQALGVPAKTDVTPLVQELGKITLVLQDIHERLDTSIKVIESMNMKMKDLVDVFQVSRSPEVDGALGETIATQITEKFDFKFNKLEAEIEALKEDIKDMKKELKKLGKK